MDQGGGRQGVSLAFAAQMIMRQASQILIDDWYQLLQRLCVPAAPLLQQAANPAAGFPHVASGNFIISWRETGLRRSGRNKSVPLLSICRCVGLSELR